MSIAANQSTEEAIRLLKAQRQLYSSAKVWWGWDFFLTIGVTMIISAARVLRPETDLSVLAGGWAVVVTLLSLFLFRAVVNARRAKAAKAQEMFDGLVLGVEKNDLISPVPEDEVLDWARCYDVNGRSQEDLEDWFPPVVDRLPGPISTAVCQRITSRWDKKLRWRYLFILAGVGAAFLLFVGSVGLSLDWSLRGFLLSALLPLLPGIQFIVTQILEANGTARRLRNLADHSDRRIDALANGSEPSVTARNIQDALYQHRKAAALIPDRFYQTFRNEDELSMTEFAESLVERIRRKSVASAPQCP
jgi:hypothetical protein